MKITLLFIYLLENSKLQHPCIVQYFGLFTDNQGFNYIVTELLDGDLRSLCLSGVYQFSLSELLQM